ncbi:putative nuclease HARBI1 isoform X2 [Ooceraea biroi]|uniref:putative nuclease HARBI1 isoform X2 n=1 Tax=Ooceraea biroi TaxID=2015173 RepID=UPI000F083DCD|nr:putative nuclease HARBI1 isoform X2 [Ooceraea biroi]
MNFNRVMFINEMLESSSSDDEENLVLKYVKEERPKINNYMDIINEYSDKEFQRNFRLQRNTYVKLKDLYEESNFCQNTINNHISHDVKLLAFLWFAARYIITFPETLEEKTEISREFENINGFPGILGCIDGTYITIRTPAHKIKSTYVNRHDISSLTLQAICDSKKKFLDIFTGPPSKIHDARVFNLSFISTTLPNICGNEWHILGDTAYPLKKYLITPYKDYGNLTEEQRNFNYKFCVCRVKIENAFGLLKARFRQLLGCSESYFVFSRKNERRFFHI